jgi:hypothetical protein
MIISVERVHEHFVEDDLCALCVGVDDAGDFSRLEED